MVSRQLFTVFNWYVCKYASQFMLNIENTNEFSFMALPYKFNKFDGCVRSLTDLYVI